MIQYNPGERVFFVTEPHKLGTVVEQIVTAKGYRVTVLWDDSQITTSWDPKFIFPAGTLEKDLPATIRSGDWVWYKSTNQLNRFVTRRRQYGSKRH